MDSSNTFQIGSGYLSIDDLMKLHMAGIVSAGEVRSAIGIDETDNEQVSV